MTAVGYQAVHLDDLMPAQRPGEFIPDEKWIRYVGANGWIALCVNPHMVRTPSEVKAIRESGARVFSLGSVQATEDMKHFTFGRWWVSILRRAKRNGPCLWRLYIDRPTIKKIP